LETIRVRSDVGLLNIAVHHVAKLVKPTGPPALILHGATFPSANAAAWKVDGHSWMDDLAQNGFDTYALDFLGFGASDRYPEMVSGAALGTALGGVDSMVMQVERAVASITARQPGLRTNRIAHSAGTFVAARYAELHPQQVSHLVLFGAPTPSDGRDADGSTMTRFVQVSSRDQLEAFEPRVRESGRLNSRMFTAWADAYLASDSDSDSRQPPSVRVPAGMMAAIAEMNHIRALPYDPAKLTIPTLVIQGEWDAVTPPNQGLWLFEHIASVHKRLVILSQGGHRLHLERSRTQLFQEVRNFLAEQVS